MTGNPVLTLDAASLLGSFSDSSAVTFDATTANTTPLYLTFNLDPASTAALGTLSANTLYAFTITSSSAADPGFRIERSLTDDFADGNGIFTGGNGIPLIRGADDLVFFLQGTGGGGEVLKGDVDMNGEVTFLDINPFIAVLSSNGFQAEADCDCDGDVDFLDIASFIDILAGNS